MISGHLCLRMNAALCVCSSTIEVCEDRFEYEGGKLGQMVKFRIYLISSTVKCDILGNT